ncbi:hypothetical protein [Ruminococcus sp.]|uniref:hypothetical protein n=1 Tax=Ruminococcus sp. TaxID=41978 RepID=UPI0025FA4DDF|nr:hypothetical protein [Ruminococcus sp.]
MSYVYPGVKFTGERTQPIDIDGLINSIQVWAEKGNLGVMGAPTYKSSNKTAAYFDFLEIENKSFLDGQVSEFKSAPDKAEFQDLRKYMIILSNILLAEYLSMTLKVQNIDYFTICDYDGMHDDLQKSIRKWAVAIDKDNADHLTEICMELDHGVYPLAFYSTNGLRIYPFNTINIVALSRLIGWDSEKESFTFEKFKADLDAVPGANRALYSALNDVEGNLLQVNAAKALSQWLSLTYPGEVLQPNGAPFPFEKKPVFIQDTTMSLDLPICAGPLEVENKFSDQLLIIKSNSNVLNHDYSFCVVENMEIGITDTNAPVHAVIPPLSEDLMDEIRKPDSDVDFIDCKVVKAHGAYEATIYLKIKGALYSYTNTYAAGDVRKCDNFPLISVLVGEGQPTSVRLIKSNYDPIESAPVSYLNGRDIQLGSSTEPNEMPFDTPTTVNDFPFFGVRYHNAQQGRTFSCGYLFLPDEKNNSDITKNATSTAVVIDDDNNVAQISVWDTAEGIINSYNVYNDKIIFFNKNSRDDFNNDSGKIWGSLNQTVFEVEGGSKYALAPFSREFADMIAKGNIQIAEAHLEVNKSNGNNWDFSVAFQYGGKLLTTAPRIYKPEEQFLCANPPFIYAVDTINPVTGLEGYEVVLVQNMRYTYPEGRQNPIESNDLVFQMDNKDLNTSSVFISADSGNVAYIGIFDKNDVYYGQITFPLNQYRINEGFYALKDATSKCDAILLVSSQGAKKPKQIITGRVFDDSLFLMATENVASLEYQTWRNSGLLISVNNMMRESVDEREYEAVFPFSLKMLQNLMAQNLVLSKTRRPYIQYDQNEKKYEVSVFIDKGDGSVVEFTRRYSVNAVVKCDNLPSVIPLEDETQNYYITRFNNELEQVGRQNVDGSNLTIEYVEENQTTELEVAEAVPIQGKNVILRLIAQNGNAQNGNKQYTCNIWYKITSAISECVYGVQSNGSQHVFDFKNGMVREISVFTDYMMWTPVQSSEFANGTQCQAVGTGNRKDMRVYSIPITMEFSQLMEKRNLHIADYTHVKYYTNPADSTSGLRDVDNCDYLYVEISLTGLRGSSKVVKKFHKSHILNFVDYPLPTLTVFPFVNFVADESYGELAGTSLWQEYSYAKFTPEEITPEKAVNHRKESPLGSRVEFWINDKKVDFEKRSTKIMDAVNEDSKKIRMEIAKNNGWGQYIHMKYDGSNRIAPSHDIDVAWDGKELGCIIMKPANEIKVSRTSRAIVGVDFGTRNSIIAINRQLKQGVVFPFHGQTKLQQIIIPGMQESEFMDFSNLSYIPHFGSRGNIPEGCGKFSSTTMVYSCATQTNDPLIPYDSGFIPNVQGNVLKRIMERMGEAGTMGDVLGFYSDLKISTSGDSNMVAIMQRNVRLFIKSLMFHTVLNCFQDGCGDINIRISMPSEQFRDNNKDVWTEAKDYIEQFIPKNSVQIGEYATEATALFTYIQWIMRRSGSAGLPKYSAITDGGDGTYDFTINKLANGNLMDPQAFSLRYAGQQIMTDSINVFYDHLVRRESGNHSAKVKSVFKAMWCSNSGNNETTLDDFVNQLSNYRAAGGNDREREKTLVLMLVEKFGIDCAKLKNNNSKTVLDKFLPQYQNFARMIQYKFLFLFNILGEQVRKKVDFTKEIETSFTIFLYGGTAQALTIAEPFCQGNLQAFASPNASKLPMVMFIKSMMNLPKNRNGADIQLKFIPAKDAEKREIASGLILMRPTHMKNFNNTAEDVFDPNMDMNIGNMAPESNQSNDDPFDFGDAFGDPFGDPVNDIIGDNNDDYSDESNARNVRRPDTVETFIEDLKHILKTRTMTIQNNVYSIDKFLPFLDEKGKPILLSGILDDPIVRDVLGGDLTVMWDAVLDENMDIDDPDLLYHIYTLKMVGLAIETYLKK